MLWILVTLIIISILAYQRASLAVWTLSFSLFFICLVRLGHFSFWVDGLVATLLFILFIPLHITRLRYLLITKHLLRFYQRAMPVMSTTEREALAAGTVSWEAELFSGKPNWQQLFSLPKASLSPEEQAFYDGPLETLCAMIDDWDITYHRADLPEAMWKFLKETGFFGLNIPKKWGGKEFSAYAHSQILTKVYGRSTTVATTIAVPNSLGPAELLLHYGTSEQQAYYLPRLARGEEVPCFALTGPEAGSDAGSMTDTGIVSWGQHRGETVLGLRLNFNKRYITLAPIATVIGLAFKMFDPDHLLGDTVALGITCALIPRETPGISIGRRHFPANVVFQNGPIYGKDVFIPLEFIIGGPKMAGRGWQMLMECLAAGRAITLPASSLGGAKMLTFAAGAYARIRKQFNVPIGRFEGIESVLARMGGFTYLMDATRTFTASLIDQGAKPAVASAITKYHVTELGRVVALDGMDLHGGKGICLGPANYAMRLYESVPISITVEGANILTRCMMIFGQGAMRCHPYLLSEYTAAQQDDMKGFDRAFKGHVTFTLSNLIRTIFLGLSNSRLANVPSGQMQRYLQHATRFSAAFALLADTAFLIFGGALKRREDISGRLGDLLSYLYLFSATLKHYEDQGSPPEDAVLVEWVLQYCLHVMQERTGEILQNFPNRIVAWMLKLCIFPFGNRFAKPRDQLGYTIAELLLTPSSTRERVTAGAFVGKAENNPLYDLADALQKSIEAEPIEKIIKAAGHSGSLSQQAETAHALGQITKEQFTFVLQAEEARRKVIAVDDFAPEDLARHS